MVPDDVGLFISRLEQIGLVPFVDDAAFDVVVMDQMTGPTTYCDWIEGARFSEGYLAAWLSGTEPGVLCAPDGWTVEKSQRMKRFANPGGHPKSPSRGHPKLPQLA